MEDKDKEIGTVSAKELEEDSAQIQSDNETKTQSDDGKYYINLHELRQKVEAQILVVCHEKSYWVAHCFRDLPTFKIIFICSCCIFSSDTG